MYGSISNSGGGSNADTVIGFAGMREDPQQPGPSNQFDSEQFTTLCDNITSNIFAITKHGTTLEKTLKTIGSPNDSKSVRESVHVLQLTSNRTIGVTTKELRLLNIIISRSGVSKEDKMRVGRLTSDFGGAVKRYTDLQKLIVAKMKTTLLRVESMTASVVENDDAETGLIDAEAQKQAQLKIQQELEFEQGLLLEREEKIRQIESDILDVNTIMRELGTMVSEQGETIDSIEDHINSTHENVDQGRQELFKAASYQTKHRKRLLCLFVTGLVALIILIAYLIYEFKN